MALPFIRPRPDFIKPPRQQPSTAETVPQVRKIRAPRGSMVGHYALPRPGGGTNVVTASAQVIHGGSAVGRTIKRAQPESWQDELWTLRTEVGELRFAGDRAARAVSQVRLFIAELPDGHDAKPEPVTSGPVYELGRPMFGDRAATQQGLHRSTQHLEFNGETNLLIRQHPETGAMTWSAHSVYELTGSAENLKLDDGVEPVELTDQDLVVRCWLPDPKKGGLADCPARSVLPVARELKALTQHTSAQIDSRLAGAGLLVLPDTIEVLAGQASDPDEGDDDGEMDDFVRALVESMTVPLTNHDSASSVVPLVIKVPEAAVDKIQHIKFASDLDTMAKDMREEAIRRVALGMDSDPSVLLGLAGGNHWSAWLVSEDETKLMVAPMAATICHSLTTGWLHPILEQIDGIADPTRYLVWFDLSALELRPDKSADARTLNGSGLLSDAATMAANGFDPDKDKPNAEEFKRRVLLDLLKAKPDLAAVLLPELGIELAGLEMAPAAPAAGDEPPPAVTPPDPPEENDGQDRDIPQTAGDPPPAAGEQPGPGAP